MESAVKTAVFCWRWSQFYVFVFFEHVDGFLLGLFHEVPKFVDWQAVVHLDGEWSLVRGYWQNEWWRRDDMGEKANQ